MLPKKYVSRAKVMELVNGYQEPDWNRLIFDLRGAGVATSYICQACGFSESTLQMWIRGKQTKMNYKLGVAILKIHKEYCNGTHEENSHYTSK